MARETLMTGTFGRLTATELAALRTYLHRGYITMIPVRNHEMMTDQTYLLHEVSRAERGREPSRAVERHWAMP